MNTESKTHNCPLCKEEIKSDAIKCKHCGSSIAPEKPAHEGTCPYCKEKIHPDAIKCKHCKSDLRSLGDSEGGCSEPGALINISWVDKWKPEFCLEWETRRYLDSRGKPRLYRFCKSSSGVMERSA